ncbi:fumarylacetoacetate hydrolase family protein [Pseudoalteromonas fenneropenaei]|uniref:Fumarylacetoacetate hydrolase family protein n=1 Tax=Pseudoalteromonas fenneropenaei TaxID=1737459 RepID=A0ABV7CIK9_9GAMM
MYTHYWQDGTKIGLNLGKIVCVGRNYADHAKELDNPVPEQPLLFMKPKTAAVNLAAKLSLPAYLGAHHYEAELALLVGETITRNTVAPLHCIHGVGLALDLTLRDVQAALKAQGYPWERAKAYDKSCPLTPFTKTKLDEHSQFEFKFWQNDELKQQGDTSLMLFSFTRLLTEISRCFTLEPGDVVLTGTPKGVGVLRHDDKLALQLGEGAVLTTQLSID